MNEATTTTARLGGRSKATDVLLCATAVVVAALGVALSLGSDYVCSAGSGRGCVQVAEYVVWTGSLRILVVAAGAVVALVIARRKISQLAWIPTAALIVLLALAFAEVVKLDLS